MKIKTSLKFWIAVITGMLLCTAAMRLVSVWWVFVPAAVIIAILFRLPSFLLSFLTGFLSTFLAWMILYCIADIPNYSILSEKMAALFSLPNHYILFLTASFIMGIMGGLSAGAVSILFKKNVVHA